MINYKFSGLPTCFIYKKAIYNTKIVARGPDVAQACYSTKHFTTICFTDLYQGGEITIFESI